MLAIRGLSALQVRWCNLVIVTLVVGLCIRLSSQWHQRQSRAVLIDLDNTAIHGPTPEEVYLERLADRYGLTNQTRWQAWKIQPSGRMDGGSSLTNVGLNFGSQTHKIVDLRGPNPSDLRASKMMTLPARGGVRVDETDASDFLFGISTTYERIADREWALLRAWERWLTRGKKTSNGAGFVLMLDKATDKQLREVEAKLHAHGLGAYLLATNDPMSMARRYHELVRIFKTYGATLAASGQRKTWFGLVEDTVFFPDLSYLRQRLAAYNADEELFIGLTSERQDWQADGRGMFTYGGGAVLMSRRAVDRIPGLPCLEVAKAKPPVKPKRWDALLKDCVKEHAGLQMRVMPAFYSPGEEGEGDATPVPAGHEEGVRPLVLHDYQDRHRLDVGMAHLVTDVCGEACFMQRYVFHDRWVLINGVSISQHPDGLEHHQPRRRLGTERAEAQRTGRSRRSGLMEELEDDEKTLLAWTGRRNVWRLLDSTSASDGSVWQAYLKRGARGGPAKEREEETDSMDSVIVLIWEDNTLR
ncbi:hypothetical protein CDD83_10867 [Cordyceps sp. RAO-2017]|nr:hypothetical protein CDD83_10867 [Cordyceps sp. RAO-2017]